MTNLVGILNEELKDKPSKIAERDKDLVGLLLQKIKTIDIVFRDIACNLAELLSKHRDLIEKLLKGDLSLPESLDNKLKIENKYNKHIEQLHSIHKKQKSALISTVKLFLKLTKKHIKELKRFKNN